MNKPMVTSKGVDEVVVKGVAKEEVKEGVKGGGEGEDKDDSKDNNRHRSMDTGRKGMEGNNMARDRIESLIANNIFSPKGDIR